MIIICDASPMIALHNIGKLDLLHEVYGEVHITHIVQREVEISLPDWIIVTRSYDAQLFRSLSLQLDEGEASSIALGVKEEGKAELIIDEKKGRRVAKELGLLTIGLLGVIVKAKLADKIKFGMPIIEALTANGFRASDKIISIIKDRLRE